MINAYVTCRTHVYPGPALTLAMWGAPTAAAVFQLPWLTPPPSHSLHEAHSLLYGLGVIHGGVLGAPPGVLQCVAVCYRVLQCVATLLSDAAGAMF